MNYGPGGERGPLEMYGGGEEHYSEIAELRKLEKKLDGVSSGMLEVEGHIIDRMKIEAGASNMKLWAEALEIVRKMERRT